MRRGTAVLYGPIKFDREDTALNVGDQTGEYRRKQHMVHQAYMADMAERVPGETPGDWIRFEKVQTTATTQRLITERRTVRAAAATRPHPAAAHRRRS